MRIDNASSRPPPPDLISTNTLTPLSTALSCDSSPSDYDAHYSGSSMSVDGNSSRGHASHVSAASRLNHSITTVDSNTSTTSRTSTKSTTSTKSATDTTSTGSSSNSRYEEEEEGLEYVSGDGSGISGDRSGSAMDLDDFNQLFGLGIDLDVGNVSGSIGQPPPIQGSSTITPSQLHLNSYSDSNQSHDAHDFNRDMSGIPLPSHGSIDHLHFIDQYLDLAFHNTKPFGSFSDLSGSLVGLDGDGSSEFNRSMLMNNGNMEMRGRTLTGTNITLGGRQQQDGGIAAVYPLTHYHQRSQPLVVTSSPAAPPILQAYSLTDYRSPNILGYQNNNTSGSSFGVSSVGGGGGNSTTPSTNSFVQSSPELLPPSSVSPLTLQSGNKGRVVVDLNGSGSHGTGDESLSLSNVGSDGSSFAFLNSSGGAASASGSPLVFQGNGGELLSRSSARGSRASNLIMRRTNSASVGPPSKLGSGRGTKKGTKSGKQPQVVNVPIPLPIPTRSKKPSLIGWGGDTLTTAATSTPASPPRTAPPQDILPVPPYPVTQTSSESRKRKRGLESGSDEDVVENAAENVSRRELLGLRKISKDTKKVGEEEEVSGDERKRKRRRIGSLSGPAKKGKGKERKVVWSSDDDDSDDSDDSDAYFPSSGPSSPGVNDYTGSSFRPPKAMSRLGSLSSSCTTKSSYRRSSSTVTLKTPDSEYTSMSPEDIKEEEGTKSYGSDKRNKGKAKGSAALALAKVTMLSGKEPTSVWGTYIPFPSDEAPSNGVVRSGRTRRNGHIPLPIPVPDLIKKSRGRKVPYQESKKKLDDDELKRVFVCKVAGCGKCFVRGEHLKRHVRSIHTHDKPHPCPYEGCDKSFSRRDNLGQHVRIHLQSGSS